MGATKDSIKDSKKDPAADLATLVRKMYLDRGNGVVEVRHAAGTDSFFFRYNNL